jgi:serine/threonine-protein kinase
MAEQAAPRRSSAPPAGRILADRYALLSSLGRGSMGSVWIAEDRRLGRRVAVKILGSLWAKSSDARRRFEREAMAVAKLQSPHIVQVFDYGIYGKRPYIVMELISGEDLQTRLAREGRLGLEKTAAIVLQVCRGLHVAHKAGLVHRDLKPGNVMIDTSTGEELVKVLDFGVAKVAEGAIGHTLPGTICGTPTYMSPEQAGGQELDWRSDLYALGVVLYECLAGVPPFAAPTPVAVMLKHAREAPPPLSSRDPPVRVHPELEALLYALLEKDRSRRPVSAAEVRRRIDAVARLLSEPGGRGAPRVRGRGFDAEATAEMPIAETALLAGRGPGLLGAGRLRALLLGAGLLAAAGGVAAWLALRP